MSADWGPVVVSVVLFILLSPGLLFQLPARTRIIEFGNMYTSGIAILIHAIIYFCIITILIIAVGIHIHSDWPTLFYPQHFFHFIFFFLTFSDEVGASNSNSTFLVYSNFIFLYMTHLFMVSLLYGCVCILLNMERNV